MTRLLWLDRHTVRAPYLALCLNERAFQAVARHCDLKDPGTWLNPGFEACTHTWSQKGKLMCVVCLDPAPGLNDPIATACLLVHEAVHVYQQLCDSIGETQPGKEFEAYTVQGISDRLMREFVRQMQPKSKTRA